MARGFVWRRLSILYLLNIERIKFQVFLHLPSPAPAPVPRCSPFIIINKLAEFNNLMSDSNPYFPVPPCEYGGPLEALARGDLQ